MMLMHVWFLLFLCGIKSCTGSSSNSEAQEQAIDSKDASQHGIKKNEVGANGLEANWEKVLRNFRNPVLEYLLRGDSDGSGRRGVVREIRHSQTLFIPPTLRSPLPGLLLDQMSQLESLKKQSEERTRDPDNAPADNFWNFLKNRTQSRNKTFESVVSSPVLHLNKDGDELKEETKIQTYPAVAVVINTFNKDGSLKKSLTHFQPDFSFLETLDGGAPRGTHFNRVYSSINSGESYGGSLGDSLGARNAFAPSMYNAVSSVVEYAPAADTCPKDHAQEQTTGALSRYYAAQPDVFGEVTMRSDTLKRLNKNRKPTESVRRKKRDATSIFVKSREGDAVAITLEEPPDGEDVSANTQDERARSFSQVLVNTPPLSTILRPPQQGYADKKRKTKPSKPAKEEGNSEEVGEEQEEESTSQSQESANEAVAISPPPEGASVAEAKPIGLAIAGPGGVAASKPQGTAVAGPGGLAIARPVGTAIAGVDVEGSVPIGGQQKNKKKPKQEKEQTEGDLHYVGGLTGPIGNPQPKEFADSIYYKTVKDTEGNNIQENLFFRGVPSASGFQLRLGQQNGNDAQGYDHFPKYQTQF